MSDNFPTPLNKLSSMSKETITQMMPPDKSTLTDMELIDELKRECRRVKIQRNEYEQKLLMANRELVKVCAELKLLENYINRKYPTP